MTFYDISNCDADGVCALHNCARPRRACVGSGGEGASAVEILQSTWHGKPKQAFSTSDTPKVGV
jgi:hypothetical protein